MVTLAICIPTYNNHQQLDWCLHSLFEYTEYDYRVVVIDNESTQESHDSIKNIIQDLPEDSVTIVQPGSNLKWMGSINVGLHHTHSVHSEYFCMMNDDVVFIPGRYEFWRKLCQYFSVDQVGAVGPSSNFVMGDQSIFRLEVPFHMKAKFLIGFCMIVRTELLKKLGGLDENLPGGDDLDLSMRIRDAGYDLIVDKTCFLHHLGQQTGTRVKGEDWDSLDSQDETMNALIRKHGFRKWFEGTVRKSIPYVLELENKKGFLPTEDVWYEKCMEEEGPEAKGVNLGCGSKDVGTFGLDLRKTGEQGAGGERFSDANQDITGNADDLPFKDESLDYIIAAHILEHLLDPISALAEWKRVLKKGGSLYMSMPDHDAIRTMLIDYTHVHAYTPKSIQNLLERTGWIIDEIEDSPVGNFCIKARSMEKISLHIEEAAG